jgi:imidazole glycerol phosphate synthase subunit HisF
VSDAITKGLTDAIGAASIFHYNTSEIPKLKQYLAKENITTRII